MKRVFLLLLMAVFGIIALYLSRFWFLDLWSRQGLFGYSDLRPGGGLLDRWLRGTEFRPFELIIWIVSVFLLLTWLQKIVDFLFKPKSHDAPDP